MHKVKLLLGTLLLAPVLAWSEPHKVVVIDVKGMTCPFCVYGVSKDLGKAPGVAKAQASLEQKKARIVLKPGVEPDLALYKKIILDAGFTPGEAQVSTEGQ